MHIYPLKWVQCLDNYCRGGKKFEYHFPFFIIMRAFDIFTDLYVVHVLRLSILERVKYRTLRIAANIGAAEQ